MVPTSAFQSTALTGLKQGQIALIGRTFVLAMFEPIERSYVELATARLFDLPAVDRVIYVVDPVISVDPRSVVGPDEDAPDGSLVITSGGPGIWRNKTSRDDRGTIFFCSGLVGAYDRGDNATFKKWQLGARVDDRIEPIIDLGGVEGSIG